MADHHSENNSTSNYHIFRGDNNYAQWLKRIRVKLKARNLDGYLTNYNLKGKTENERATALDILMNHLRRPSFKKTLRKRLRISEKSKRETKLEISGKRYGEDHRSTDQIANYETTKSKTIFRRVR